MRWAARRPWVAIGIGVGVVVVVVGAGWAFWPTSEPTAAPRARAYKDVDVCLLTDAHGISAPPGRQAWQGLQDYSKKSAVRVSYVPVIGPATAKNAAQYLAGLVQRRCRVVVVTGPAQIDAAKGAAQRSPDTGFVLVTDGGQDSSSGQGQSDTARKDQANLVSVNATDPGLPGNVSTAVSHLAKL